MNWIFLLGLTFLGGKLYRMGGIGDPYNTKVRDFGVPAVAIIALLLLGVTWSWQMGLALFCMFGLMFGSMTTYCKFGDQEDVYWYNWALTGLLYGLSALPLAWVTGHWLGLFIRTIVLTIAICVWSELINDVNLEEGGRGGIFVITIPLLYV